MCIRRDTVQLGLVRKDDHRPGQAGSFAIAVTDLDAMRAELAARSLQLSQPRMDECLPPNSLIVPSIAVSRWADVA